MGKFKKSTARTAVLLSVLAVSLATGCSSEPVVVDTICEPYDSEFGYKKTIFDDGTSEYVLDEFGNKVDCWHTDEPISGLEFPEPDSQK
ncbi:MAG: hypothetical protein VW442_09455 [Acidimicrobiaceae bacterium]